MRRGGGGGCVPNLTTRFGGPICVALLLASSLRRFSKAPSTLSNQSEDLLLGERGGGSTLAGADAKVAAEEAAQAGMLSPARSLLTCRYPMTSTRRCWPSSGPKQPSTSKEGKPPN